MIDTTPQEKSANLRAHPKILFEQFGSNIEARRKDFLDLVQKADIPLNANDPTDPIRVTLNIFEELRKFSKGQFSADDLATQTPMAVALKKVELLNMKVQQIAALRQRYPKRMPDKFEHYEYPYLSDTIRDLSVWLKNEVENLPWQYFEMLE